ncbi:hypothetical protein CRUP_007420 [Coryphaenoides rupestris]|nr:hypothetical protein CRUP_007420 [Coryphaenoides rupestris]
MREVDLGSGRALLIKEHGEFSAIAHKCPHYGAPLVRVEKDKVIIRANKQVQRSRPRRGASPCPGVLPVINSNTRFSHVLIIGSGPAGLVCAETLRQEGFTDRIVMVTAEKDPPYDRPKLSKSLESTAEQLRLRSPDFLQDHDIELLTEKETRPMSYQGKDVANVFHLETTEDANSIARLASNRNAVVVGTSFVGEKEG